MKTIQISDEDYNFLSDCIKELKTQDNRGTRQPFYTVWHEVRDYGISEDYSIECSFIWDDDEYETIEDLYTFMNENGYEEEILKVYNNNNFTNYSISDYENHKIEIQTWFCDSMNVDEIVESMADITQNLFYKVGIRKRKEQVVNGACFSFFEKDAFDHIKLNGHNIQGKIHTYADSLFRTPRMEKLLQFLHNLELKE